MSKEHASVPASGHPHGDTEIRCCCGSLLARRVGERIELKCRRCKRVVYVEPASVRYAKERAPPYPAEK